MTENLTKENVKEIQIVKKIQIQMLCAKNGFLSKPRSKRLFEKFLEILKSNDLKKFQIF